MKSRHAQLAVSNIEPGEHIGVIYEHPAECLDVLVPFIMAGIERRERIWLFTDGIWEPIAAQLNTQGYEVASVLGRDQLKVQLIRPDWQTAEEITRWLRREIAEARAAGYTGLWIAFALPAPDTNPPPELKAAEAAMEAAMETAIETELLDSPCVVLCFSQRTALENSGRLWSWLGQHSSVITTSSSAPHRETAASVPQPGSVVAAAEPHGTEQWLPERLSPLLKAGPKEREHFRLQREAEELAEQLKAVFDTLTDAVIIFDPDGRILRANPAAVQIYGTDPVGFERADFSRRLALRHLDERPVSVENMASSRSLRGEVVLNEPVRLTTAAGHSMVVLASSAPIYKADRIVGAVLIWRDVTEREHLAITIDEERRRFEGLARELSTILETIDVAVAITDRRHRIVRANRTLADQLGESPVKLLGRRLLDFSENTELETARQQVLESGQPLTRRAVPLKNSRGVQGFWDIAMAPIPNPEGQVEWVLNTYTNVSEHIRTRREIELERARWLATLTTLPMPVVFIDPEGWVQMANQLARTYFQHPLMGECWWRIVDEHHYLFPESGIFIPLEKHPLPRALQGELVQDCEVVLVQPDGNRIPMLLHASPVTLEGRVVGAIQVGQDLTRVKEADRIKDQFLAMVSHDLRSPLATIKGWAMMAQESQDPDIIRRALDLILKGALTQQRLIEDLLDSAALTVGTLRITPEVQDIRPIVESVCLGAQATRQEQGITLRWTLTEEPLLVSIDGVRLQQILGNLITNAYKFTPKGGEVEIRLIREAAQAVLTVRDTGRGIPAEQLPHIFNRFYSPGGSQLPTSRSLGLGLAIVKALVELHGGRVTAWSAGPDKGSTFTVRLPLANRPA